MHNLYIGAAVSAHYNRRASGRTEHLAAEVTKTRVVFSFPIDVTKPMADESSALIPQDEYLKAGLHIGTKFRTASMRPFIFKVRQDGLAVLDVQKIDERMQLAARFLAQYNPQDILVTCRRENGWEAVRLFAQFTGVRAYTGRYPPGILTNPKLETFIEVKLVLVCDPFPDKNIVEDAAKIGIPVIALCDTNNELTNVDLVIPCNNKGKKSLGLIFWVLTKEYLKAKGVIKSDAEFTGKLEEFAPE